jgi:ParB family chromosome partitioning protein
VANYLRLLKLPPEIQLGLRQRQIGMGHARASLAFRTPPSKASCTAAFWKASFLCAKWRNSPGMTSPQEKPALSKAKWAPPARRNWASTSATSSPASVTVKQSEAGKGKIEIPFKNDDDLARIKLLLESR